jgi:two-component system, chemotaxis family, response regulator Rcp1
MHQRSEAPMLNLLLAEDNLPDALVVQEAIRTEDLPLTIFLAPDGQEAIDFITRAEQDSSAPCPQVLLLDLNLPKQTGFEVLRRLRNSEKCKHIPVVIMTSSDSPEDLKRAAAMDAAYFRKPSNYDDFLKLGAVLKQTLIGKGLL